MLLYWGDEMITLVQGLSYSRGLKKGIRFIKDTTYEYLGSM